MSTKRDIATVIEAIQAQLPDEQLWLRGYLSKMKAEVGFTAPEFAWRDWDKLGAILAREIGDPKGRPWADRVSAIMRGEEVVPASVRAALLGDPF